MIIHYINKSGLASTVDAPVTNNALHKATLMKEDYIKLSFVDVVDYEFPSGSYVTFEGMNYYLAKDYVPTMKNEATYSYDLQFNAPWYNLDTYMFFYNTLNEQLEIARRESEWYITDTAANILNLLIKNTQDPDRVCPCRLDSVFYCEGTPVKTFTFSNTSVLGALNNLAKDFELEWWVEYSDNKFYLHFGECDSSIVMENGSVVFNQNGEREKDPDEQTEIVAGQDVTAPKISQKKDLKKYYYVYGSSRNIDQTVEFVGDGATVVTSIVTKRLPMLNNPQTKTEGTGEEVVIFDDIYPRSDWMVTHVESETIQSEEIDGYDEDGNPHYKTYKVYNLRLGNQSNPNAFSDKIFEFINDPTHTPSVQCIEDCIASGKILSLKFIIKTIESTTYTPKLAGFEFELGAFLNTNVNQTKFPNKPADYQWYEFQIIKQDINGYIIPNDTLIPEIGDWICLFNLKGWVVEEVNEGSTGAAQQELQEAFNKYYNNLKRDISYSVKPYIDESWIYFGLGKAVTLKYGDRTVVSRISAFEKKLYHPQDATYTISAYNQPSTVNQLQEEVKIINANIANGQAFQLDGNAAMDILTTYGKNLFLSKTQDDSAAGEINFAKGLTAGTFQSGSAGAALYQDADGNWTAEVDNLTVRRKLQVTELDIQRLRHIGGQVLLSPAEATITEVEVKEDGNGKQFILRWPARDSEGNEISNDFAVDDQVICQTFNSTTQHYWWRRVWDTGTVGKKHYISVSYIDTTGKEMDCAQGSGVPQPGDKIAVLGNRTKSDRQSAIIIAGAGTGSPFIAAYKGISSYTLPAAKVYISPAGIALNVDGQVKTLDDVLQAHQADIDDIKSQSDEQVVLWFGEQVPTLDNEPASSWNTDDLKLAHIKDIYYNKAAKDNGGRAYSFEQVDGKFMWLNITDKDVLASLEKAERAQDTADGKRRVFVSQPVPPYDPGDLWVNATYPTEDNMMVECPDGKIHSSKYPWARNDILRCAGSKTAGESFAIDDWRMAQEVTTAYASEIKQSASDIKLSVTELSSGLETAGIHIDGANSRISLNADTTTVSGNLVVNRLKTLPTNGSARIEAEGSEMRVYGSANDGQPNIVFGIDATGHAVLKYYDNAGNFLYDLGPNGVGTIDKTDESYFLTNYTQFLDSPDEQAAVKAVIALMATSGNWFTAGSTAPGTRIMQYIAARVNGNIVGAKIVDSADEAKGLDRLFFSSALDKPVTKATGVSVLASGVATIGYIEPVLNADGTVTCKVPEQYTANVALYGSLGYLGDINWAVKSNETGELEIPVKIRSIVIMRDGKAVKNSNGYNNITFYWQ